MRGIDFTESDDYLVTLKGREDFKPPFCVFNTDRQELYMLNSNWSYRRIDVDNDISIYRAFNTSKFDPSYVGFRIKVNTEKFFLIKGRIKRVHIENFYLHHFMTLLTDAHRSSKSMYVDTTKKNYSDERFALLLNLVFEKFVNNSGMSVQILGD